MWSYFVFTSVDFIKFSLLYGLFCFGCVCQYAGILRLGVTSFALCILAHLFNRLVCVGLGGIWVACVSATIHNSCFFGLILGK
jgi:hypothetical protein